ncbi:hypothetical protein M8C21_000590, partial [Ambrosia artemisiifolia]
KKTLDPPVSQAIYNAITVLEDVGALSPNEELTELGEKLGSIPVHPVTSKMLLFAISMNCLDPALTLACASNFRDPFTLPMSPDDKVKANAAKSELASLYGSHGDQLAIIAAFECWKNAKQSGNVARFCSQYFVSPGVMRMLYAMREQLKSELHMNGFIPENSRFSENSQDGGIINAVLVAGLYPMVGRLFLPTPIVKRCVIKDASDQRVCVGRQSVNSRLTLKKKDVVPLVIYNEVTRGDAGLSIKNCSIIGPLPLLLLATEIAVAPINDDNETICKVNDEDGNKERVKEKFMSNPDTMVEVIADRWLSFKSTALDAAQICCLRERLSEAILFKIAHPGKDLPRVLAASVVAIAKVLSSDGISGINEYFESADLSTSVVAETDLGQQGKNGAIAGSVGSLRSLLSNGSESQPQHPSNVAPENIHPNHDAPRKGSLKRPREDTA